MSSFTFYSSLLNQCAGYELVVFGVTLSQFNAAVLLTCLHYGPAGCIEWAVGGVNTLARLKECCNILHAEVHFSMRHWSHCGQGFFCYVLVFILRYVVLDLKMALLMLCLIILVISLSIAYGFQKAFSFETWINVSFYENATSMNLSFSKINRGEQIMLFTHIMINAWWIN